MTNEQAKTIGELVRAFRAEVDKIDGCSGSPKFSAQDHERMEALASKAERLLGGTS